MAYWQLLSIWVAAALAFPYFILAARYIAAIIIYLLSHSEGLYLGSCLPLIYSHPPSEGNMVLTTCSSHRFLSILFSTARSHSPMGGFTLSCCRPSRLSYYSFSYRCMNHTAGIVIMLWFSFQSQQVWQHILIKYYIIISAKFFIISSESI